MLKGCVRCDTDFQDQHILSSFSWRDHILNKSVRFSASFCSLITSLWLFSKICFTFCSPHESRSLCDSKCKCKIKMRLSPSELESKACHLLLMENLNVHMALKERWCFWWCFMYFSHFPSHDQEHIYKSGKRITVLNLKNVNETYFFSPLISIQKKNGTRHAELKNPLVY